MPKFWIIRHAKTGDGARDHDRELTERGHRDGANLKQWLTVQEHPATWIWSSSATRAQQTSQYVHKAFDQPTQPAQLCSEESLYLCPPERVLTCLQETPGDIDCAAVVAHNPGLTYCANLFSGTEWIDNLPTFGCVLFEFDGRWSDLQFGRCTRLRWMTPKMLREQH